MTRYQLLKLVSWVGTLHSRKRLQKVAFLLQAGGCPLEADFFLDTIGPYSDDVRHVVDELVVLSLLTEHSEKNGAGEVYSYSLAEPAREQLAQLEQTERGRRLASQMAPFEGLARSLLQEDVKELDVAASMLYFRRLGYDWGDAVAKARSLKSLPADGPLVARAEKLARSVEESAHPSAA
jgi:uncharacterized protein YwgA